jgi:hypothetical protein
MNELKCPYSKLHKDCFCNIDVAKREHTDKCFALRSTHFYNEVCPFYKPATITERLEVEKVCDSYGGVR